MINQILKSKIHIFILFIVLPNLSCNQAINNPIQHFEKSPKQRLTHSKIVDLEEFDILRPGHVIRKDDSYMIWDLKNETLFHLVDFDSKKVIKGIRIGNGPGETISPTSLQLKDGKFFIFDFDRKK